MKIGFLHSSKQFWGNDFNAKLSRVMYDDWKADPKNWFYKFFYGQHTDRDELRGLIYKFRTYEQEWQDIPTYDLIAISLNFDHYPDDFHKFVTAVLNDLYTYFPILYQKEVIVLAGNEVYEKRRSVEKVVQTTWDTAQGVKNSMKNLPICCWNQAIGGSDGKEAFTRLLSNQLIGQICKYVGFQSLGTRACDLRTYITYIKNMGYEPVDVELGHQSEKLGCSEELFKIGMNNGIKKVFILCPKITKQCADFYKLLGNCALKIDDNEKDKYKLIKDIQKYKDKKEEIIQKMLNEAIMGTIYKYGTRGYIPKLIQKCLNIFLKETYDNPVLLVEDGLFGSKTREAVMKFQESNTDLKMDGIVGQNTMRTLINWFLLG